MYIHNSQEFRTRTDGTATQYFIGNTDQQVRKGKKCKFWTYFSGDDRNVSVVIIKKNI